MLQRILLLASIFCFTTVAIAQDDPISLAGVIDMHCHTAPDATARSINDFDLVRLAKRDGMRGIVLKNHYVMTADRAQLAMKEIGGIEVFGGVVLNRAVGGLNAEVVSRMIQMDGHRGKIVWLPTFDSEAQVKMNRESRPFVRVVENGHPVPELIDIFRLVAENDLVLATGHSSASECLILTQAAKQAGVKKILITHAMADPVGSTDEQLKQLADMGAILECVWLNILTTPSTNPAAVKRRILTTADYSRVMKSIGAEHFIISSDLGQQANPVHPDGMKSFIKGLLAEGISQSQIDQMARKNPAMLLGMD